MRSHPGYNSRFLVIELLPSLDARYWTPSASTRIVLKYFIGHRSSETNQTRRHESIVVICAHLNMHYIVVHMQNARAVALLSNESN